MTGFIPTIERFFMAGKMAPPIPRKDRPGPWNKGAKGLKANRKFSVNCAFTEEQVLAVKARLNAGELPGHIARELRVTRQTVARIQKGESYSWIKYE